MTIDPRAAKSLRDARTRLRDIAAARHSSAQGDRDRAAERLADEQTAIEAQLGRAAADLGGARSVHQLALVGELLEERHGVARGLSREHAEASAVAQRAADALRDRTRQLRTAEKLVELAQTARDQASAKTEQRATDDLVAARSK